MTLLSSETSLRPKTPLTPLDRGGPAQRAHCAKHRRYNARCPDCHGLEYPGPARPGWCGVCDETTRHVILVDQHGAESVGRCPACHPLTQPAC